MKMNNEIDETLKRIESTHKSVTGVLVCNQDGVIIKSTFNDTNANSMSNTILQIVDKAKDALKDNDELTFVKMKTKKTEFIVVPDNDFMLITILNTESNA